ncbi:unnamed protein product [marine sediment metagenome]|uniref:Uncharacterized protein n=1 Tax=marine sediment metagenome TaxID=412755 RepID=X1M7C6_9ZZZZ
MGFVVVEKTKELIDKILFNRAYINLSETSVKEYRLWMYVKTFNAEILRFFDREEIKKLIIPAVRINYEGKNYICAFDRFKKIITNFSSFFWTTICLLFLSLISLFLIPLFKIGFIIRLIVVMNVMAVFSLSFFSLIFAALVIKSLFLYGSKKEIEKLKKEIFRE